MRMPSKDKELLLGMEFFYKNIPVESRRRFIDSVFFNLKNKWRISYWLMMTVSCGICSIGLSENSAATIIGAMIITPLGQPIVALSGAIALGWKAEVFRMIRMLITGAFVIIALSYSFGIFLNSESPNEQILSRTSPDMRDLGIALLAGIAGAYGNFRIEYSNVLAGVAIAVALIPPLCACGLMLEQHHFILAKGSALLFITNFIGITFSAILVFLVLGIKHSHNQKWFYIGTMMVLIGGIIILFPLVWNFKRFAKSSQFQSSIYRNVAEILRYKKNSPYIKSIEIQGSEVIIAIQPMPDNDVEKRELIKELQQSTGLQVLLQ